MEKIHGICIIYIPSLSHARLRFTEHLIARTLTLYEWWDEQMLTEFFHCIMNPSWIYIYCESTRGGKSEWKNRRVGLMPNKTVIKEVKASRGSAAMPGYRLLTLFSLFTHKHFRQLSSKRSAWSLWLLLCCIQALRCSCSTLRCTPDATAK